MRLRIAAAIFGAAAALAFTASAHAQCPSGVGSSACEPFPTYTNNAPAVITQAATDRIPYVQGSATHFIPPILNWQQTITGAQPAFLQNQIVLTDSAAVTSGSTFGVALAAFENYGGSAAQGGRVAFEATFTLTSPTSAANVNRNYVGIYGLATANSPDNGVSGAPEGGIFAFAALATALSGATNLLELAGSEINVDAETGSSMYGKFGWTIVSMPTDAVHGTIEGMLGLSNQIGAVGWSNGILFSPFNGVFPIDFYGSLLSTIGDVGGSTILNGFDLSGVTVSGCALNLLIGGEGQCAISGHADIETEGNIGLTTGATSYYFYGPAFAHPALRVIPNPAGVNWAVIEGNTAGNPPVIKAAGTDTNINLDLEGQGTGLIEFANSASWTSGSHATVQEWLTVVDSVGVTRYIPAY